jgi:group I intron endonuclease
MTIYMITNLINGKQYVGQTTQTLKRRWNFHVCGRSGCIALKSAFEKYGKENFKIEPLFVASSLEELDEKEVEFISSMNTIAPNGYNLTSGGERPVFSEETRKKMSDAKVGKSTWIKGLTTEDSRVANFVNAGHKAVKDKFGSSGPHLGHKHSQESKLLISKNRKGKKHSEETKAKISLSRTRIRVG